MSGGGHSSKVVSNRAAGEPGMSVAGAVLEQHPHLGLGLVVRPHALEVVVGEVGEAVGLEVEAGHAEEVLDERRRRGPDAPRAMRGTCSST